MSINSRALSEAGVFLGSWTWRVFAVTKGAFAVTKVVEAANVSLLALYKEGQSDPDPPSVDPGHSPPELRHEPRVQHVRLGTKPATIARCHSTEYPLSPTARYPSEL